MALNSSTIVGRLGKDIEVRQTPAGKSVVNFSLAVNDAYNKETTYWLDCVAWGKAGELLAQYTKKGSKIGVSGNLQTRDWEDKNGSKHKTTEINVRDFEFLDAKGDNNQSNVSSNDLFTNGSQGNYSSNAAGNLNSGNFSAGNFTDADLPF